MEGFLKDFLASGKALITDTKMPKVKSESVKAPKTGTVAMTVEQKDPHKVLVKRCIDDKISKKDLVEEFKKFVEAAEADL